MQVYFDLIDDVYFEIVKFAYYYFNNFSYTVFTPLSLASWICVLSVLQMSKQTIGIPAHALQYRMDTKLYKLQVCTNGQYPLLACTYYY